MDLELTPLRGLAELEQVITDSHVKPVLLFKHSYTCGISAEALDELRAHLDGRASAAEVRYAMVTVQTHRDVSNAIASRLGVRHETPQAILVHGGRAVWSASHFRVNAAELTKALTVVSTGVRTDN
jgi:bacillithiol system protein YtxJ